jgi:putative DNA primase/helicase
MNENEEKEFLQSDKWINNYTYEQKKQFWEEQNKQKETEELLTKARSYYATKNPSLGDEYSTRWLLAANNIRTDIKEKLYVYDIKEGIYRREGEILLKGILQRSFGSNTNRTRIGEIIAKVQSLSYVEERELIKTTPPNLIPLQNGIYDLTTKTLLPHSPEYFFTYKHPVIFDDTKDCPVIQKYLTESVETEREKELLLDIIAVCIYRARITRNFYVLVGGGHNGKTLFINLVKAFIGKERIVSMTPQAFAEDTFAPAQLDNKHANLGADIPGGIIRDTAIIKNVTGGDSISVQRKGVDREDKEVYCELVWASNTPPLIPEDTLAIWDRLVVIHFPYTFVEDPKKEMERKAITGLEEQMITPDELSGLFNLIMKRIDYIIKNKKLNVTLDAQATRKQYRILSDTPSVFIEEMCEEVEYDPGESHYPSSGYLTAEEAYREYKKWCKNNRAVPVSATRFGKAMEFLGFEKAKDRQARSYRGLQFRQKTKGQVGQVGQVALFLPVHEGKVEERIEEVVLPVPPVIEEMVIDGRKEWMAWLDEQPGGTAPVDDLLTAFPGIDYAALRVNGDVYEPRPGFVRRIY